MIYDVAFSGRETMLTRGTKEAKEAAEAIAKTANKYVSAGKIYTQSEIEAANKASLSAKKADAERVTESAIYTNPFASTSAVGEEAVNAANAKAADNGYLYAVAHGTPASIAQKLNFSV